MAEKPVIGGKGRSIARDIGTGKGTAGLTGGESLIGSKTERRETKTVTDSETSDLIEAKMTDLGLVDAFGVGADPSHDVITNTARDTKRSPRHLVVWQVAVK